MAKKLKLGVLISGRGSNLQALIDACAQPSFPAEIAVVISNVPKAFGLSRAEEAGLTTMVVNHKDFDNREAFEHDLHEALTTYGVDLICLAGFMRLLSAPFVSRWTERIINIHPSLLPAFKGLDVHDRVIEAGVRFSGCTVHFVVPEMDSGPIIVQAVVPVHAGDDADSLAERVLEQEHRVYPLAVHLIAENRVSIEDGTAVIKDMAAPDGRLINPDHA